MPTYTYDEAIALIESKKENLIRQGVKIPGYKSNRGLALICLTMNYGEEVKCSDVLKFVVENKHNTSVHTEVRQLWADGLYVLGTDTLHKKCYKLVTLDEPLPKYIEKKRKSKLSEEQFEEIKKKYNYECASCHCKEGEPHPKNPSKIVKLQMGHMDPNKELTVDNCIPQCPHCNQTNRDDYIYNKHGGIEKINNINVLFRLLDYNEIKDFIKKSIEKYGEDILKD